MSSAAVESSDVNLDAKQELKAMGAVHDVLSPLSPGSRQRVIAWVVGTLSIQTQQTERGASFHRKEEEVSARGPSPEEIDIDRVNFSTCADLFSMAQPKTNASKALVGGYWLQVCQGAETFTSFSVNNELKNLGEVVINITSAFDSLRDTKPQLAMQVRKDGRSRQARKKYKLTVAGITEVERMLGGDGDH